MNAGKSAFFENIALHDKNTFAIGGPARYYCAPENGEQVSAALLRAARESLPLFVLGKGSNVLISDHGWPGLVMHVSPVSPAAGNRNISWNGATVEVTGGTPLNTLVKDVVEHGYAGMEELAGIPGTVGGAVVMNAGAFSCCIADTLFSVDCCNRTTGKITTFSAAQLNLGYRTSVLKTNGEIVIVARFFFSETADPVILNCARSEILDRRRKKQPLEFPNCGSVFKRPPGNFAGTLIEQCGLKGLTCGGAEVSVKHANFIINTGEAKADEVRHLVCVIQKRVFEQCGVLLEPEVIFVGDFEEPLFTPSERGA